MPSILVHTPPLIGYYRMLLGISRKEFSQAQRLGYEPWLNAEESGRLPSHLRDYLDQFCAALITTLVELVQAMSVFDDRDLSDLTLLTLGPTLQGGRNNVIGTRAADQVFAAIRSLVALWVEDQFDRMLRFTTPGGRTFEVVEGSDPDVCVDVGTGSNAVPLLAIEIKGGGDAANAHNRAGEAEKSQIKAKAIGYRHRWTVSRMRGVDRQRIREETPTCTEVFEAADVVEQTGLDWQAFRSKVVQVIGVDGGDL